MGNPSIWAEKGVQGVLTTAHSAIAAQFERAHPGPSLPAWDVTTIMPALVQKTVQYIDDQTQDKPFFAYVPFTAPHTPIAPSAPFFDKSEAGRYGDFVHQFDWSVGQIREALERNGMTDNTLLIVTSDHGPPHRDGTEMAGAVGSLKKNYGHDASYPWRGIKSEIWEGGSRVPFIVHWPEKTPSSSVCNMPISLVDMMKTFAALVDYEIPEGAAEDSLDISASFFGQKCDEASRDHIILHSSNRTFAIRHGNWKLILGKGSGGVLRETETNAPKGQLYHLLEDPKEENNLYDKYPDKVSRLNQLLEYIQQEGEGCSDLIN